MAELEVGRFGLRTFNLYNGKLQAVVAKNSGLHWENGVCRAHCVLFDDHAFSQEAVRRKIEHGYEPWDEADSLKHEAPDLDCRCGIYGSLNLENLRKQFTQALTFVAVIASEGKTIIGTRGFRTQYARVVAYWTPWYHFYARRVMARECPEAKGYRDLNEMLKDYGIPRKADPDVKPISNPSSWWTA